MRSRNSLSLLMVIVILSAALLALPALSIAQEKPEKQARTVDAATRSAIIEKVIQQLNEFYIDSDVAKEMEEYVRGKHGKGEYDRFVEQRPFLSQLTKDLQHVSKDLHLGVWPIEWAILTDDTSEEERKRLEAVARYQNYGLNSIQRLPGNIGYLELSYFEEIRLGGDTAVAAMNFLANCDALIFDVRRNGGGSSVLGLIMSYLFDQPTHTMNAYSKVTGETSQGWTFEYVPGPRLADIPVYVLLSRRTASAAEALGYQLKASGRATLVGERSRGAANPIEEFSFPELSICMAVSAYRVSSPITGTCWEGVGVEPDIEVTGEKALYAAAAEAMKKLLESEAGEEITLGRQWALEMYQAQLNSVTLSESELLKYIGQYGDSYKVKPALGTLILERSDRMPVTLIPLGNDLFAFEEEEGGAKFARDDAGKVTGMNVWYFGGYNYSLKRTGE